VPEAAKVLDRRQEARVDDEEVAHGASSIRGW
jgi:hypothetical protein